MFSLWGLHPGLDWLQDVLKLAAVGLAGLVAFFPRGRRSPAQVAALGAAVLIAVQLPAMHWFYFYVAWFMPFVLVALFAAYATARPSPSRRRPPEPRPRRRAPACPSPRSRSRSAGIEGVGSGGSHRPLSSLVA